jgi:phosphatidylglycerol:prolipoprotein diacylglycerol transferase
MGQALLGPFVHNIDPVIGQVGGLYLWWYGASYSLGFLGALLWIRRQRERLGYDMAEVYDLVIILALGVLIGGRAVEIVFYEWSYYGTHPWHIPAFWLGGMSTHGILLGAAVGTWWFCKRNKKSYLAMVDTLAIAGAYIMGVGRLGNFIDGQIAGSVTGVSWAVKFPDLDGYRHPVVLYDGLKNLLLVPLLLFIRRFNPPPGVVFGHFLLWYGFLRIFVDFFREYRTDFLGLPPGQEFNVVMSVLGIGLIAFFSHRQGERIERDLRVVAPSKTVAGPTSKLWPRRVALTLLLLFPLIIPSDWTQDVPDRYGKRHSGMVHSTIYPEIVERDPGS